MTLLIHSSDADIANDERCQVLVDSIRPVRFSTFKRAFTLLNHRLVARESRDDAVGNLLYLTSSITRKAKASLGQEHLRSLRQFVFQLTGIKNCSARVLGPRGRKGNTVGAFSKL